MLTTVGLLAVLTLAAGDSGQLSLTNVRTTYGVLGAERPNDKFLPGDLLAISFDIEGAKPDAAGKLQYSIGLEVADAKGKVLFKKEPHKQEAAKPDGNKLPACATLQIGLESPAGDYTVKVTVADRNAGTSQELSRSCQVLPKALGIVRPTTTSDAEATRPVAALRTGRPGWINFAAVGFGWDKGKGQPNVTATMRVLDEEGRDALAEPSSGTIDHDVPKGAAVVPMRFEVVLQKAGKYTAELEVKDNVTGEKATLSLPFSVSASKD